jgi:GntR family transcriptional repressor for pyruvate dehydrogenase complex
MPFEPIQAPRIYQQIAARVAEMIAHGELRPGERLPSEPELARVFGVGRNSVREAMIALEAGGMVEVRRSNGYYVREDLAQGTDVDWSRGESADPGPLEQFEVREALEPEAAARAATRITDEQIAELEAIVARMKARYRQQASYADGRAFMELIAVVSGNPLMASMIQELWRLRDGRMWTTLRTRISMSELRPEDRHITIELREAIIAALRARNPHAARRAVRRYLRFSKRVYFGDLADPAGPGEKAVAAATAK